MTLHEPDGYKYSAISSRSPFEMTANMTAKTGGRLWTLADNGGIPTGTLELAPALMDIYGWQVRGLKNRGEWVGPARSSIIGAVGRERRTIRQHPACSTSCSNPAED